MGCTPIRAAVAKTDDHHLALAPLFGGNSPAHGEGEVRANGSADAKYSEFRIGDVKASHPIGRTDRLAGVLCVEGRRRSALADNVRQSMAAMVRMEYLTMYSVSKYTRNRSLTLYPIMKPEMMLANRMPVPVAESQLKL